MDKREQWRVGEAGEVIVNMDKPRALRLTHRAMKTFSKLTACKLEDMEDAIQDPVKLEALYYSMLLADAKENGESLKVTDMEALMDTMTPGALIGAAGKALELAYADAAPSPAAEEGDEKNADPAAGTGKTA